jgi:uncharacterized protein YegP (UPF0339 family)
MMSKYEIYRDTSGEWRWRLKSGNGKVVAQGEGYKTRGGARSGVRSHRRAAATAKVVELD